jgi:C_GCAxxG_C_C family probable redox protein
MTSNKDIIKKAYDLAYRYEAERGSCPQCVTAALYEALDVGDPKIIQAADSLAGGGALSTEGTCGALVGGFLAIGAIVGRTYQDFSICERKRRVFQYSKKLYDKFIKEYGAPLCKNVHMKLFGRTFNLMDQKEYAEFERLGAHVDKCPSVSGNVARWTAEIVIDLKKTK